MKKIRIPLTASNSTVTPLTQIPAAAAPAAGASPSDTPLLHPRFSLSHAIPTGYDRSRYAHPATDINISVPDSDIELVRSWLGAPASAQMTPSETLSKRMTSAVITALKTYFASASRQRIFTAPFKIGCALRHADGSLSDHAPLQLISPDTRAPLMVIPERKLNGTNLITATEIVSNPVTLTVTLPPVAIPPERLPGISGIVFYATRQADLLTGDETVTGIRTYQVAGENMPGWAYQRQESDLILSAARRDTAFRIIDTLPLASALSGINDRPLPAAGANLADWESFPKVEEGDRPGGEPGNPEEPDYSTLLLTTAPLHLESPDEVKRVRAVTLRGIFPRGVGGSGSEVSMVLYGSRHRDRWHRIASARGPHLRLLRAAAYRWYMLEITAPRTAKAEALLFTVAR